MAYIFFNYYILHIRVISAIRNQFGYRYSIEWRCIYLFNCENNGGKTMDSINFQLKMEIVCKKIKKTLKTIESYVES